MDSLCEKLFLSGDKLSWTLTDDGFWRWPSCVSGMETSLSDPGIDLASSLAFSLEADETIGL